MMLRLAAVVVALGTASAANAQFGSQSPYQQGGGYPQLGPGAFGPNPYNRASQPISPYLNLLRGGNPAANYFYGVRPGTTGGGGGIGGGAPMMAPGAMRGAYFPLQQMQIDPVDLPKPIDDTYILPPAGHPVVYSNTLGFYPGAFGMRGAQQRSALQGAGGTSSRPATPAPKR